MIRMQMIPEQMVMFGVVRLFIIRNKMSQGVQLQYVIYSVKSIIFQLQHIPECL